MTDQTPAGKVREIIDAMRAAMRRDEHTYPEAQFLSDMSGYIRDLEALLPPPPRPTLADMYPAERAACRWMQADAEDHSTRFVIVTPFDDEAETGLISADGGIAWVPSDRVTPRPDLPRMEWPAGDQEPAPAPALPEGWRLADHKDNGRVIVTNTTPSHDGRVYYVLPAADPRGYDWLWCDPDALTYIDSPTTEGDGTTTGPDHLAVGTVIESADDPRIDALPLGTILLDRNEEATTKRPRPWGWTGLGNTPAEDEGDEPGPWTVLHIPKESDQ